MSDAGAERIPEAVHGLDVATPHHHVNYLAVFITLVILTIVTVVVAFVDIRSETAKVLLALTIASVKATAVVLYFMHVKFEGKLIYLILFVPVSFAIMLVIALLPDITYGHIFHDVSVQSWRFGDGGGH